MSRCITNQQISARDRKSPQGSGVPQKSCTAVQCKAERSWMPSRSSQKRAGLVGVGRYEHPYRFKESKKSACRSRESCRIVDGRQCLQCHCCQGQVQDWQIKDGEQRIEDRSTAMKVGHRCQRPPQISHCLGPAPDQQTEDGERRIGNRSCAGKLSMQRAQQAMHQEPGVNGSTERKGMTVGRWQLAQEQAAYRSLE